MITPIVSIPTSIANGLATYKDLFPRSETYQHIQEYCTGILHRNNSTGKAQHPTYISMLCGRSMPKQSEQIHHHFSLV